MGGASFRNVSVVLTGADLNLSSVLKQAAKQLDELNGSLSASNDQLSTFTDEQKKLAALAGGAVVAGLTASVLAAADFQTQMANVNSISYLSTQQLATLGDQVLALSRTLPQDATTLASGLYDIASSGFQGADGLAVLKASAQAASAGMTDTATSAQAITAVLNAYGLSASQAGHVSDALFQTVNLGVVSFGELAGTIGDVVGIAAAAGISIDQVGAAIATMTLSGISGAESGTSLNRVIQGLIKPSDTLQLLYKQLGYESGLSALKQKGLHTVIEDIGKATGGSATAMLQLFPDIRAVRGALALLTQQGQLYTKQADAMAGASNGVGATQRALSEQMKAASFQFHVFVNNMKADAINLGLQILPVLVDLMHGANDLVANGLTELGNVSHALGPTWKGLRGAGLDLLSILSALGHVAAPIAGAIAGLAGTAVIASLNLLAATLNEITGFLNDNKEIVEVLIAFYGVKFALALLRNINFLRLWAVEWVKLDYAQAKASIGAYIATARLEGLGASIRVVSSSLLLATARAALFVAPLLAIAGGMEALSSDTSKANDAISQITSGTDWSDFSGVQQKIDQLRGIAMGSLGMAKQAQGIWGTFHAGEQLINPFETNSIDEAASKGVAATKAMQQLADELTNVKQNSAAAAQKDGLTGWLDANSKTIESLAKLAQESGIDITKPVDQSASAVDELAAKWKSLQDNLGGAIDTQLQAGQIDLDQATAMSQAISDAADAAGKAFSSAEDIIGGFQLAATVDDVAKAQKTLTDAQAAQTKAAKAQDQLEARLAGKRKLSVAQQQQLTNAQDKTTQATQQTTQAKQDLADVTAKAAHPDQQYKQFLADQLKQAQDFVTGVQAATKRGLNQTTVQQLLTAGPKDAAPVLQAIAADHSGNLIKLVNQTETTLAGLNQQTVEDARLTQRAIASSTDQMSRDLSTGLSISNLEISSGGKDTAAEIAAKLGLAPDNATRIATEFGITLAQTLSSTSKGSLFTQAAAAFGGNLVGAIQDAFGNAARKTPKGNGVFGPAYADGGEISGAGTSTSDSILARVSNGEYVVNADAVRKYGIAYFDAINSQRMPRFAGGGGVGYAPAMPGTVQHNQYNYIERLETPDPDAFKREMDRRNRLQAITGRANA